MKDINELREQLQGLTEEQLTQIGGGSCSIDDVIKATSDLTQAYENLIDFTSYVIERIANTQP